MFGLDTKSLLIGMALGHFLLGGLINWLMGLFGA